MYICTYVAVTLRNVDQCCRFPACGFLASEVLACRFLAGRLSFINQEDDTRFSTLKINLQASAVAFGACKARSAISGAERSELNIFTLQLCTLQITVGPGNKAMAQASRAVRACCARAATYGVQL